MTENINWPTKTRELHNHHFDSTVWNDINFRDDDIVIGTYAKTGTTWMQQIVAQLLFDGRVAGVEAVGEAPAVRTCERWSIGAETSCSFRADSTG